MSKENIKKNNKRNKGKPLLIIVITAIIITSIVSYFKSRSLIGKDSIIVFTAANNYLPDGSYIKAVLISPKEEFLPNTPYQVTFRIISEEAYNDTAQKIAINLRDCLVTGEARRDQDPKRLYTKLLKMSCRRDGNIIETDIEGYAVDGANNRAGLALDGVFKEK